MIHRRAKVAAVVLAAGASTRFGSPKQLALFEGESLIRRAARAALESGATPVVVVLGACEEAVRRELGDLPLHVVANGDWAKGLSSSIAAGIRAVRDIGGADGVLFTPADQPLVDGPALASLVSAFSRRTRIVAAGYSGTIGAPAVIAAEYLGELEALEGDRGAGAWIREHRALATVIPMEAAATDIDVPGTRGVT